MVSGDPAIRNKLDAVRGVDCLEQPHGDWQKIRQLLGMFDQSQFLAGIEFLHEIVEVFGLLLEDDGVEAHLGNLPVLPPKLVGVGQHEGGVLAPVFLGSVDLMENIRRSSTNILSLIFNCQNPRDLYLASSRAVWRR